MPNFDPLFKSPLTDLGGDIVSHQFFGECADMEMKAVDCLEAHGMLKGVKKCNILLENFKECVYKNKQLKRIQAMQLERERQYKAGERSKKNRYAEPPTSDSY